VKFLRILLIALLVVLLTALTQIGGVVLLISLLLSARLLRAFNKLQSSILVTVLSFLFLYTLATFVVVPPIARICGRLPLPMVKVSHLQPANILTCFLNRNYVIPQLKEVAFNTAKDINRRFPGTEINYLDGNFPFLDGFPLFPHLSHNDGKKLDLSFRYLDAKSGTATNEVPSFSGYGICEVPTLNEEDKPSECAEKGFWQYNLLYHITDQKNKSNFKFDPKRTRELLNIIIASPEVKKIFIEPHLVKRLNLRSKKIRFHGCQAVRHDDHIHLQL
jgi:uncharacterized membrane protein